MLKFGLLCMLLPLIAVLLIAWWAMGLVPPASRYVLLGYIFAAVFACDGMILFGFFRSTKEDAKDSAAAAPDDRPGL